jgi:hypothetical protein
MPRLEYRRPGEMMQLCEFLLGPGAVGTDPDDTELMGEIDPDPVILLEMTCYVPVGGETFSHSPQDPHIKQVVVLEPDIARALHHALGGALESG